MNVFSFSIHNSQGLTSELVAGRLVVGELVASEGSDALCGVAAGAVEGSSATERRTLK